MTGPKSEQYARDNAIRQLAAQGIGSTEIARRLGISPRHVSNRRTALGVSHRPTVTAPRSQPATCQQCRNLNSELGTLQGELGGLASRAARARYGPPAKLLAWMAERKDQIADAKRQLAEHVCDDPAVSA